MIRLYHDLHMSATVLVARKGDITAVFINYARFVSLTSAERASLVNIALAELDAPTPARRRAHLSLAV